jgi:pseudouridine kinase
MVIFFMKQKIIVAASLSLLALHVQAEELICIGGAHMDDIYMLNHSSVLENTNHARLKSQVGGVAYNMARLLKTRGNDVGVFSVLGEDLAAQKVLQALKEQKISSKNIVRDPLHATTLYTGFHDPNGELIIAAIDMDIYSHLSIEKIQQQLPNLMRAKAWVFDSTFKPAIYEYFAALTDKPPIYVTICSVEEIQNIIPILGQTKVLFGNLDEISRLADNSDRSEAGIWRSLEAISARGVETVVCTHGKDGIYALSGQTRYRVPAVPVTVVGSTNGAGDTLSAAIINDLMHKKPLQQALHSGVDAAAQLLSSNA